MLSSHCTEIFLILNLSFTCLLLSSATQVDYDANAIIINGERRVLFSGAIHYPRSTPQVLLIINLQFLKSLARSHFLTFFLFLTKTDSLLRKYCLNFFFFSNKPNMIPHSKRCVFMFRKNCGQYFSSKIALLFFKYINFYMSYFYMQCICADVARSYTEGKGWRARCN